MLLQNPDVLSFHEFENNHEHARSKSTDIITNSKLCTLKDRASIQYFFLNK